MTDDILLVNTKDEPVGTGSKADVHANGALHRAFSVFLYSGDRLLIQKRAAHKYHSAGLWANTCCSHPAPGEKLEDAVRRRLMEEAGISCDTKEIFSFIYKHQFAANLFEHELDHVFLGEYDGDYEVNRDEAEEFKWMEFGELRRQLKENPDKFACWFQIAAPRVLDMIEENASEIVNIL